jgi:hypothetical protein
MPVRLPKAALVLVVGLTVGVVAVAAFSRSTASPSPAGTAGHAADSGRARPIPLTVLHAWDERRAAAWAAGNASALAALYTPGSPAGSADLKLLRRYAERGLRVRGMRMQVLGARTLTVRPHLLELEVIDRLASAVVFRIDDPQVLGRLPSDAATTHRLVLRRVDGRWLVARVLAIPSAGAGDR